MLPPGLPDGTATSIATMTDRLGFATVHLAEVPSSELLERLVDPAAPALARVSGLS
jgi:hypothetical protein